MKLENLKPIKSIEHLVPGHLYRLLHECYWFNVDEDEHNCAISSSTVGPNEVLFLIGVTDKTSFGNTRFVHYTFLYKNQKIVFRITPDLFDEVCRYFSRITPDES